MERVVYKKSFTAKMVLAGETTISVYQKLREFIATKDGLNTYLSFEKERISFGKERIAIMKIARKNISIYLHLDPKTLIDTKYRFEDVSNTKAYINYPTKLNLKSERSIKHALELINSICKSLGVKRKEIEYEDYTKPFYYRDFNKLLKQGFIRKYVYRKIDNKVVLVEEKVADVEVEEVKESNVHFVMKLLYCAANEATNLYIVTNQNNWDPKHAVKMKKVNNNLFEANIKFKVGTDLEFKVCRSESFKDVEKGIWKEEIVNHHYVIGDTDLEVEDLIHNFRN